MDRSYYREYYFQERNHWWFKVRASILKDTIKRRIKKSDLKILNVGSGTHLTSEMLSELGNVTSIEYDKDCCVFVKEELGYEVTNGSATDLPYPDNSFDLVCAFDVVEHIEDDQKAIAEIERVCKTTDGYIFLTVPAYQFLWSDHDIINHHFRRYTLSKFKALISSKATFIKKSYFNTLLFPLIALFRLIGRLKKNKTSAKSDFENFNPNSLLNVLFGYIFKWEYYLLRYLNFPFGVSIMILYKFEE